MSFDVVSFLMGRKGLPDVILDDDGNYVFTDDGEGNITITKEEANGDETA